jgi:hypothetical protein
MMVEINTDKGQIGVGSLTLSSLLKMDMGTLSVSYQLPNVVACV